MQTKKCSRCKLEKHVDLFGRDRNAKSGIKSGCKACENEATKKYRKAHPERVKQVNANTVKRLGKEYYRENHQRLKREMIAVFGGKCDCCGETETEFLSLDHINGGGNIHRKKVGGTRVWRDLRALGWPKDGYRILCMNCQFGFKNGRTCPHQLKKEPQPPKET